MDVCSFRLLWKEELVPLGLRVHKGTLEERWGHTGVVLCRPQELLKVFGSGPSMVKIMEEKHF